MDEPLHRGRRLEVGHCVSPLKRVGDAIIAPVQRDATNVVGGEPRLDGCSLDVQREQVSALGSVGAGGGVVGQRAAPVVALVLVGPHVAEVGQTAPAGVVCRRARRRVAAAAS